MAALFPSDLYTHTGARRDATMTPEEWNQVGDEVEAIEAKLGVTPQGTFQTVKARLDDIASKLAAYLKGGYINLRVTNNAATPTAKVDVTADVLVIEGQSVSNFTGTADITVSAAVNGRDTATAEAANTWYYVWAGYNSTTGQTGTLLSTTAVRGSLTQPAGYDKWRRVGAVRNDGSSNFYVFYQQDALVLYAAPETASEQRVLSAARSTTFQAVSCAKPCPTTATKVLANASMQAANTTAALVLLAGGSSAAGFSAAYMISSALNNYNAVELHLDSSQQVQYKISVSLSAGGGYLDIMGYLDGV